MSCIITLGPISSQAADSLNTRNRQIHRLSSPAPARSAVARRLCLLALAWLLPATAPAVTHAMLLTDSKMNAKRFANYFEDFHFEFHPEVQPVDQFLGTERGDCDDYAILADEVLRHRNFTTTLVHIRLAGMVAHAVCYVEQDRAYLDYNNRNVFFTLSRCRPSLREIAEMVADSLDSNWTSASAFTYSYDTGQKQMIRTIAKVDPPGQDDLLVGPGNSRLLVQ